MLGAKQGMCKATLRTNSHARTNFKRCACFAHVPRVGACSARKHRNLQRLQIPLANSCACVRSKHQPALRKGCAKERAVLALHALLCTVLALHALPAKPNLLALALASHATLCTCFATLAEFASTTQFVQSARCEFVRSKPTLASLAIPNSCPCVLANSCAEQCFARVQSNPCLRTKQCFARVQSNPCLRTKHCFARIRT